MSKQRVILLDRDGVLNVKAPSGDYIKTASECEVLDTYVDLLRLISKQGFQFAICTNQAGIARGFMPMESVETINQFLTDRWSQLGIDIRGWFVCPHHWDDLCQCRKPKPGLLLAAIKEFDLNRDEVVLLGDQQTDVLAAQNAGIKGFNLEVDDHAVILNYVKGLSC